MAEVTIKEAPSAPIWLDPVLSKSRGLDLLGLRVPVQFIGNQMMNGITTITPAVRYLSLRAWLLRSYALARAPDEWKAFRKWAANAEACIAVGNRVTDTHASGIVGADGAKDIVEESSEIAKLRPLVEQFAIQIYANPSRELGIGFDRPYKVPGLSEERGLRLAELVEEQLNSNELANQLRSGQPLQEAKISQLDEFGRLTALNRIPKAERDALIESIMPPAPRSNEQNRLATFTLLLEIARVQGRKPSEDDLFQAATTNQQEFPSHLDSIRDGWLAYLVRDVIAVCHESGLKCVVDALESTQPEKGASVDKRHVLETALRRSMKNIDMLDRIGISLPEKDIADLTFRDVLNALKKIPRIESATDVGIARWEDGPTEKEVAALSAASGADASILLPFVWALVYYRSCADQVDINNLPSLLSRMGWARMGLVEVIKPGVDRFLAEDWTYLEVLRELLQRTVDQHLRIAWTRLQAESTPKDVAVISSDSRRWSFRKEYNPGRTASRLDQAISWLSQLNLIDPGGLTDEGEEVLRNSLQALELVE